MVRVWVPRFHNRREEASMDNPSRDRYATVFPVPTVDELERLVVYILFDVDPYIQPVPEVSGIRQRFQQPSQRVWSVICDNGDLDSRDVPIYTCQNRLRTGPFVRTHFVTP